MKKLSNYLEEYLFLNSAAYFNLSTPPYLVKKIRSLKRQNSSIFIYSIKFNIEGSVIEKKLLIKKNEKTNFNRFGGIRKYQKIMEEIKSYLDTLQIKILSLPKIYDVIESPPLVIREYIEGKNCEEVLFSFSSILIAMNKKKIILENIVDSIFFLNKFDISNLNCQKNIHDVQIFIGFLMDDMMKEPLVFLKNDLRKKLFLYLDRARNEIKQDYKVGLISGDFQLKNIMIGDDNLLYLIDFEPFIGPIYLNIAQLITQIRNNYLGCRILPFLKLSRAYVEVILSNCKERDPGRVSFKILRFYLIRKVLESIKFYFKSRKFIWLILKKFFENDISEWLFVQ